MKPQAILSNLLTNKTLLTIIFVLSLTNIVGYLIYGNYDIVVYFILISIILIQFSKNMIIILGIPLIVVNSYVLGKFKIKEGLETQTKNAKDAKSTPSTSDSTQPAIITPQHMEDVQTQHVDPKSSAEEPDNFEVGRNKNKSKYNIDYASTIEDAYDELNNILGSDGIKNLTADTQNLMKQQLQLAEAMKSMGPLVQQMGPLMESVGPMLEQAKGIMGTGGNNIADLAKNFTAGSKKQ